MIQWIDAESGEVVDEADVPDGMVGPTMTHQRGRHAAEPVKRMPAEKNMSTALMLTLFGMFGLAGLQWLYMGKPLRAMLYFLTFGWFLFGTAWDVYQFHTRAMEELRSSLRPDSV